MLSLENKNKPMTISKFYSIKESYGHMASWAIWDKQGEKPKSNMENIDFFNSPNQELL
ncbi:uncharacterized protein METZ01_LOCUS227811, partial [marine metagenome]